MLAKPEPRRESGFTYVDVVLKMRAGLHARPSTAIVEECNRYSRQIYIRRHDSEQEHDCRDIMSVLTIAAAAGTKLTVKVTGEDEEATTIALRLWSALSSEDSLHLNFELYRRFGS